MNSRFNIRKAHNYAYQVSFTLQIKCKFNLHYYNALPKQNNKI